MIQEVVPPSVDHGTNLHNKYTESSHRHLHILCQDTDDDKNNISRRSSDCTNSDRWTHSWPEVKGHIMKGKNFLVTYHI